MRQETTTTTRQLFRRATWMAVLLVAAAVSFTACGDNKVQYEGNVPNAGSGTGGSGGTTTDPVDVSVPDTLVHGLVTVIDRLPEHGLLPGEAKPGLHLRPGIAVIGFDESLSEPDVIVDYDAMTVELRNQVRADFETLEEVWTGDVLMGSGFVFTVAGVRVSEPALIIDVNEFVLLDVLHGEWAMQLEPDDGEAYEEGVRRQRQESDAPAAGKLPFDSFTRVEAGLDLDVRGGVDISTRRWSDESTFEGKITYRGRGLNADYECRARSVTERVCTFGFNCREETREVQPENYCVERILVKNTIDFNANFGYTVTATASITRNWERPMAEAFLNRFKKRTPLGTTGLAIYVVPEAKVGFNVGVFGELAANLDVEQGFGLPIGFEYTDEHGMSMLPNERHGITTHDSLTPSASGSAGMQAKASAALTFGLELANVVTNDNGPKITGPEAGVEIAAEGKYTPVQYTTDGNHDPCLEAELYFRPYAQAKLRGEVEINTRWAKWKWGADITPTVGTGDLFKITLASYESEGDDFCLAVNQPQALEITMSWSEETDLDLYVETPNGNVIYYYDRNHDGGEFIGDACIQGDCEGELTETIVWESGSVPPSGQYKVWVVNHDGRSSASYSITVRGDQGNIAFFDGTVSSGQGNRSYTHTFSLGRQD